MADDFGALPRLEAETFCLISASGHHSRAQSAAPPGKVTPQARPAGLLGLSVFSLRAQSLVSEDRGGANSKSNFGARSMPSARISSSPLTATNSRRSEHMCACMSLRPQDSAGAARNCCHGCGCRGRGA